jgi:hypothetical protein
MRRAVSSAKQLGFSIANEEVLRSAVALLCETRKSTDGNAAFVFWR